jgi:hypothetical protein
MEKVIIKGHLTKEEVVDRLIDAYQKKQIHETKILNLREKLAKVNKQLQDECWSKDQYAAR